VIEGGGRLGLRGGFTVCSQPMKSLPWLSRLPPVKLPHQQLPSRHQQLHPCCRSRLHHLRRSVSRRSRHRHRQCHHRSRHPPPTPPRKRAKTVSEATQSSSWAAVLAKKRQIPQLDGCLSSPTSPPQPASRPLAPSALANLPPSSPALQQTSSLPVPDTIAPALSPPPPSPAGQPTSSPPMPALAPTPSLAAEPPSLHPATETSTSISPGYTLVFKWCPNCKTSLIDSHDFECYACQDRRYYCSLEYEEERLGRLNGV
jgi:hypothetical protein